VNACAGYGISPLLMLRARKRAKLAKAKITEKLCLGLVSTSDVTERTKEEEKISTPSGGRLAIERRVHMSRRSASAAKSEGRRPLRFLIAMDDLLSLFLLALSVRRHPSFPSKDKI
jgi:hypothetical protein